MLVSSTELNMFDRVLHMLFSSNKKRAFIQFATNTKIDLANIEKKATSVLTVANIKNTTDIIQDYHDCRAGIN